MAPEALELSLTNRFQLLPETFDNDHVKLPWLPDVPLSLAELTPVMTLEYVPTAKLDPLATAKTMDPLGLEKNVCP